MSDTNLSSQLERNWGSLPVETQRMLVGEALNDANGDVTVASERLRISREKIHDCIKGDEGMSIRWGELDLSKVPSEADRMKDSPVSEIVVTPKKDEDEILRSSLENLGMSGEEVKLALGLSRMARENFKPSLQIIHGGVTATAVRIQMVINDTMGRLERIRETLSSSSESRDENYFSLVREENVVSMQLVNLTRCLIEIQKNSMQSAISMATIRGVSTDKPVSGKPGFSPAPQPVK